MRAGLVGTLLNYRPQDVKGLKFGLIDVLFPGDHNYPSEAKTIKVFNHTLCSALIQMLGHVRDPLLTLVVWIDTSGRETEFVLLDILYDREEQTNGGGYPAAARPSHTDDAEHTVNYESE